MLFVSFHKMSFPQEFGTSAPTSDGLRKRFVGRSRRGENAKKRGTFFVYQIQKGRDRKKKNELKKGKNIEAFSFYFLSTKIALQSGFWPLTEWGEEVLYRPFCTPHP